MATTEISLPDSPGGSRGLRGVLAEPDGPGPHPGVVVVHEAFGVDDVMRRQVQRLADAGFTALMPDLFSQGGARRCLVATMRALLVGEGRAYVDIETARAHLAARSDANGSVGVIGFCMGGGFALMTAAGHRFDAASANYGQLPRHLDAALEGACPVVGSYGGKDPSLRGAASKLAGALARQGVPHDVKEYAEAGHSFLNDAPNIPGPALVGRVVQRVLHVGPEPDSATDAWRRIEAFFDEHLR
ncbi:carboxymethylenebutenolidase [Marmoricola endophyticus]|uniref:Carboxymethylenebutenolidase n=1 Tax=Marmoricola endophyticus TaxID=2040280 RepID=A0A917BED6_9ACTN|nr:dienelactone hydrolase family protein [Marmoricola endophyticus]GGF37664.1 carboxymethylenebutenolidase [Marmoricola endophyticus]